MDHSSERVGKGMKRRGIIAAAGTVVAGIAAKQLSESVAASQTFVLPNTETAGFAYSVVGPTTIASTNGYTGASPVLTLNATGGNTQVGVQASIGPPAAPASPCAVYGQGGGFIGVYDTSNFTAMHGEIPSVAIANAVAVRGDNQSTGANGIGVYGSSANGTGVYGQTSTSNQYGVLGTTTAPNSTAIAGTCTQNGSSAFSGGTTSPNAFAAYFQGTVVVQGNFAVTGMKSAALAHPDGSHRLVYCVESPESWIEDVGTSTLTNGAATVTFDKDFTAVVHTDAYHVFLTPGGDCNGLYVTDKTATGFSVRELRAGKSTLAFSWRVMVKRTDVRAERLGKFVMPNLPLPDVSKFEVPETTMVAVPKKP